MSDPVGRRPVALGVLVLLLLAVAGALLIEVFIERERGRDLREWEVRLAQAAEARADAIARLAARDRQSLAELAGNVALQAYLGQLLASPGPAAGSEAAERGYLRNLLVATAARDGWTDAPRDSVAASVSETRGAGLALLSPDGQVVVQTAGLADLARLLSAVAAEASRSGQLVLRDAPDGQPVLLAAVPVGAASGSDITGSGRPIGVLVGVRNPGRELYPLLIRGPAFAEDSEALLLARAGDGVLYLSPAGNGFDALHRSLPLLRPRLAEAAAVRAPGGFVTLDNYAGRPVLQASRAVRGQAWVVAQQVDADQALALAEERRGFLLLSLGALLLAILGLAVAAWRYGSSVRAARSADQLRAQALDLQRQTELLGAITAATDAPLLLVDGDGIVRFRNRSAAALAQPRGAELAEHHLTTGLPREPGQQLQALAEAATAAGATRRELLRLDAADGERRYRAVATPVPALGPGRVLLTLEDVTELAAERRRHDELLRALVAVLVQTVDRNDPYAAEHGNRVAAVAEALGQVLELAADDRASLGLAARLANLGKGSLPRTLLTKEEPLNDAERALLQSHVERSLELLGGLPFDGPVLDVIAQKQEHLDGSGYPRGLAGDQLSVPGRILAVANAFVALASHRAYRDGLPLRQAAERLLQESGTRYDRRVVTALLHLIETRGEWGVWEQQAPGD